MIALMIILSLVSNSTQELKTLDEELNRLKTDTALILADGVDEHPVWSPSGDFIALNVMGAWYKFSLLQLSLAEATWREKQIIGVLGEGSVVSEAEAEEVEQWMKLSKFSPRIITTKAGTTIELRGSLGTTLFVQKRDQKAEKIWTTELENCHSLVLSPDERYVAFICELNGVVVMRLTEPK